MENMAGAADDDILQGESLGNVATLLGDNGKNTPKGGGTSNLLVGGGDEDTMNGDAESYLFAFSDGDDKIKDFD